MKHIIFTFILLFFSFNFLFSQEHVGKRITLNAKGTAYTNEFFIETSCSKNEIKIKIKSKDSVSRHTLNADSDYMANMQTLRNMDSFDYKSDTLRKLVKKLDSATKAHTVYNVDSISVSYHQFAAYGKLLSKIFSSSMIDLENKAHNKNRTVLDGTHMYFDFLQNDSSVFTAFAHSPSELSHPLLYQYIKATLDIYRKETKNTFLTKQKSSGY
jgi:hypothetical protein